MIMDIGIEGYKSITGKIEFSLNKYTVLAGENNAGKSNVVCYLQEKQKDIPSLSEYEVIYIRSNQINPQNECSTSQKTSDFSKIIAPILDEIVDEGILKELIEKFEESEEKKKMEEEINRALERSGVQDKVSLHLKSQFGVDDVRKLVGVKILDQYGIGDSERDFNDVGQGIQRLIVVGFILYYKKLFVSNDGKNILLLMEEPEAYLHPKLKKTLHTMLKDLVTEKDGGGGIDVRVVITTHDPYFIELNTENTIYHVSRDENSKATTISKPLSEDKTRLGYVSHSEINYVVFKQPSPSYFLELYEHFKNLSEPEVTTYTDFDEKYLKDKKGHDGNNIKADKKDKKGKDITYLTELRHKLAHPESSGSSNEEIIEKGIKDLLHVFKDESVTENT